MKKILRIFGLSLIIILILLLTFISIIFFSFSSASVDKLILDDGTKLDVEYPMNGKGFEEDICLNNYVIKNEGLIELNEDNILLCDFEVDRRFLRRDLLTCNCNFI